jgi:CBS domain-containing protein
MASDVAMTASTPLVPRICDLRLRSIIAIPPSATIRQTARIMREQDIAALVVAEIGDRIAIVTERDLTAALAEGADPGAPITDAASTDPITVAFDATVVDAAATMLRHAVRHLVVARGDRAVGVVSIRDVLGILVQAATPETVLVMLQQAALT